MDNKQDLSFLTYKNQRKMGIDVIEGGYERGANQPTEKMDDAKLFLKEIWQSKPVKALIICLAGAAIIYSAGKLFYLVGDSVKGFRYMKDSWGKMAPPVSPPLIK